MYEMHRTVIYVLRKMKYAKNMREGCEISSW